MLDGGLRLLSNPCEENPASVFYEYDTVPGFMTLGPATTGHSMIIPKEQFAYMNDMDEATGSHSCRSDAPMTPYVSG